MKGIRKLFLGLILLTLFGVGFKVEAKAAPAEALQLTIDKNDGSENILIYFSNSPDTTPASNVFPMSTSAATYTYHYKIQCGGTDTGVTKDLVLKTNGSTLTYTDSDGNDQTATIGQKLVAKIPKSSFSATTGNTYKIVMDGAATTSGAATTNDPSETVADNQVTIDKYSFTVSATYNGSSTFPEGATPVSFTKAPNVSVLMNGEKETITYTGPGKGYKIRLWTDGSTTSENQTQYVFTMGNSSRTIVADFCIDTDAVKSTDLNGLTILVGANSGTINITGDKLGADFYPKNAYVGGTEVPYFNKISSTSFEFKAPSSQTGIGKVFKLEMNDGSYYEFPINVLSSSDVSFSVPSTISVGIGQTGVITPSLGNVPEANVTVAYTIPSTAAGKFTTEADGNNLKVTGVSETSGIEVEAVATFSNIKGYTGGTKTAKTTVKVETIKFKDGIYVSKDKKVTLSDFLKNGSASTNIASITNNASDYIELNKNSGAANEITIKGKSGTNGTKDDLLVIGTDKLDVTVYPEPKLSVETTGAGSSYKQTYTVKMPKGVYHGKKDDGWWIESVSKAKLVFKASSNSDKTREVTVDSFSDSSSSDEKLLKKATKELKTSDLNVIFRDLCKNDSDTISVIAYPYNTNKDKIDSEIASEKKEFTVYKITMDTSGGANYTVNGESVSDYFYGIDGVTYEIKSSGKTANATLNKNTSSSEFGSGETIQYKVAGARTLKAVYGGGSNNEGGGDNMDDYDDVPKTGESKADIWILWSVLFIAILGAGFMIWKRFGLVRAIAAAEEEYAIAEEEERIETEKKEKEDKLNMLKDLRNL